MPVGGRVVGGKGTGMLTGGRAHWDLLSQFPCPTCAGIVLASYCPVTLAVSLCCFLPTFLKLRSPHFLDLPLECLVRVWPVRDSQAWQWGATKP